MTRMNELVAKMAASTADIDGWFACLKEVRKILWIYAEELEKEKDWNGSIALIRFSGRLSTDLNYIDPEERKKRDTQSDEKKINSSETVTAEDPAGRPATQLPDDTQEV